MKILVLCYEYPPVGGGGGRVAAGVAAALAARGHEVRYVTGNVNPPYRLPAREVIDGVEVVRVASPRRLPDTCAVHEMAFYVARAVLPACRLTRKFRPDVIHAHFAVPTGAAAWLISKLTGVPYVLTAHLGDVPGGVPEQTDRLFHWIKPLTNPIWSSAAAITAVSSFVARLAAQAYQRDAEVIPNGLVLRGLCPAEQESPPHFLFVGRISVQKNLRLALESLAEIKDLPWHASIVGDGPLRAEAEKYTIDTKLADRIKFHGWMDATELSQLRRRCSVLLMPSLAEGLPMAAVEALADGLAIVGTNIPGLTDVVENEKNGFLCEPTATAFARSLRQLLNSPTVLAEFRKQSFLRSKNFELSTIVSRYEEILQSARRKKVE